MYKLKASKRPIVSAVVALTVVAGVSVAVGPVTVADEQAQLTTLALNGPTKADPGQSVTFKVSGSLNVGTVSLIDSSTGSTVANTVPVDLGTQDVTFSFNASKATTQLQAINYDSSSNPVAYSNTVTLTPNTPKPVAPVALILSGPTSAEAGTSVAYTITGSLAAGTVKLFGDGRQVGQTAQVGVGASSATVTFSASNGAVLLHALNYDTQGTEVGSSNTMTLTPTAPPTPVVVQPQAQTLPSPVPNSSRLNKGRTIVLQPAPGTTNAGNAVEWRVVKGKKRCKLKFPSSGQVKLKAEKKGKCTVRGIASPVAGTYLPFKVIRHYRVR